MAPGEQPGTAAVMVGATAVTSSEPDPEREAVAAFLAAATDAAAAAVAELSG